MAKNRLHSLAATGFVALLAGPALAQDAAAPAKADPASPASTPAPAPAPNPKPAAKLELRVTQTVLDGPDGGTQLILTDTAGEHARDVTGEAVFKAEPANVVTIDRRGYVTAAGDGKASIVATLPNAGAAPARVEITVSNFGREQTADFVNHVVPVFTKYNCNGGGCHGKSGGQNNFRLSLLGYEPWNDRDYLVRESRGRRIFPAAPENSLLLMKATGELPHEGGIRLAKGTPDYEIVARWIRQGMPYTPEDAPKVERISAYPEDRVATPRSEQQLAVVAHYSDGTIRDITRLAIYEANQEEMAEVDADGHVAFKDKTGSTSVMVRFQEHVAVFRATIPLGVELTDVPKPSNFIDEKIFKKLALLGLPPSAVCDDNTYLRRVTVDIAGRLPTAEETKAFLADKDGAKRAGAVDRLLGSEDYAAYFAQKWAGILRNKRAKDGYQRGTYAFHDWILSSMKENKPFDRFVTELVTAAGETGLNPAVGWFRSVKDPKEEMQDIAQVFLGIRMQCAQCHHHPYEKWSQDDY
ncbi:MAG: DUF1549 domain-containing protein, partial [Verrucomicrobiae bacterium]|nr:DUF1549 domain-containing protein [Verrucomicrobiae bacterium]